MSNLFQSDQLPAFIQESLVAMNITEPTDIQQKMIPEALEGQSIIARSQTGTGKTLAYLLPILSRVDASKKGLQAVILAPTQELGMQILDVAKKLSAEEPLEIAAFIGGANINRQLEKLKKQKPHIAVGTPGRILELIELKKLKLKDVICVTVDEADRMLGEKSSWDAVTEISKRIGRDKQFLFVSATIPESLSEKTAMFAPFTVQIEASGQIINAELVSHFYIECEARDKIDTVRRLIHAEDVQRGIVFVNQLERLTETTEKLKYRGLKAASLSSESTKQEREKVLKAFRQGELHILVATDIAARGLDVEDITHIIQLDAPAETDSYLHRAGRTGRVGKSGRVFTLLEQHQAYKLEKLKRGLDLTLNKAIVRGGRLIEEAK
ncbi:DEAD/DEAH box helicase [Alkalicoccobacillus murimartini]|uniref:Superfamily II DNA/RNA helicase n=1 Tax=Alkalicoccobacillus murimartini TaxID=171685 RepID=A0ABT9YGC9_9BACI|nr:DEAD/DEAH box helicase [Alkalicoccobacillus murimartini]MDQ0206566.1 superfamily II DNA/RNA helicase [Alkalicoccobacillus murimartini]